MASARLIRHASHRRRRREDHERYPLLEDDELSPGQEAVPNASSATDSTTNPFADLPVYANIWRIHREVTKAISDPYTLEQLRAPRLNVTVVRPMMDKLYDLQDISIVYCLLVNRVQFLRTQAYRAHYSTVNTARGLLCEVLAQRILRQYNEDSAGEEGLLLLSNILIAGFEPFQNAPPEVNMESGRAAKWAMQARGGLEMQMTALEIAIISESKLFLSSPACQRVVNAIYTGRIVYTPTSFIDILPDRFKKRPISVYHPRKAPILNQYRLNVPRTRNIIQVVQFIILLALYVWVMTDQNPDKFGLSEWVFCIYTFGWVLDQCASMLEHGWSVYAQNLWSFLDVIFCLIFFLYFALRVHGVKTDNTNISRPALDTLAVAAPFLVPRLAFNLFSENLLFVALRDIMGKFVLLALLAIWTFAGFFLSLFWLGQGAHHPVTIGKWMIWAWFGLDGTGLGRAADFHFLLGPSIWVLFLFLGNTLFLTIVVSTLSNIFSNIMTHSVAEIQFRKAVLTFEGVKSDAIFSFQPPFNIIALIIGLPLKLIVSPRWFHKINITSVRVMNAPLLLLISLYERYALEAPVPKAKHRTAFLRRFRWENLLPNFHVHGDIQAVFDVPPPDDLEDDSAPVSRKTSYADYEPDWPVDSPSAAINRMRAISNAQSQAHRTPELQARLEALEESNVRIEQMLQSLCDVARDSGESPTRE